MTQSLLPLGTIVYLAEGDQKIAIVGQGMIFNQKGQDYLFDYVGIKYPDGLNPNPNLVCYFNREAIDEVVFEDYLDDSQKRLSKNYDSLLTKVSSKYPVGRTKL